jgi:hypothetical protein
MVKFPGDGSPPSLMEQKMKGVIRPGIVTRDGTTIYPTGYEWLLAFAIRGCQWAIDMLPEAELNHARAEIEKHLGSGI